MILPRPEHPRPQFQRADWINLNGPWTFAFDFGLSGHARGLAASKDFDRTITVPFAPESALSGVGHTDFIPALWYHRALSVPAAWAGRRVLLHFGAVDHDAEVYLDGTLAGRHHGGSASFFVDVTALVRPGATHDLVVYAQDDLRSGAQGGGKQSSAFASAGCSYTRTTGIWQTVWLEAAAPAGFREIHIVPDLDNGRLHLTPRFHAAPVGLSWRVRVEADGRTVASADAAAADGATLSPALPDPRPWSPADPFLYDLVLELRDPDGAAVDAVRSYAGLRKVHVADGKVWLNNEPFYQRLVLDQGFWADGIWTAPSDAALRRDVELSMALGFNGARLHQKAFEERFHYWADRLGYVTWAEYPSWGLAFASPQDPGGATRHDASAPWASAVNALREWRELVVRDRNHPSVVAWSPLNETDRHKPDPVLLRRVTEDLARLTRDLDPTRPVNDASGYLHADTDLWTVHTYQQDPARLREELTPSPDKGVFRNAPEIEPAHAGQPYLVDEFGGIRWTPPGRRPFADNSWGYGDAPKTEAEFLSRLEGQVDALLSLPHVDGYCYTQLTDVEQEENGLYTADRAPKFDPARLRAIFGRDPAR